MNPKTSGSGQTAKSVRPWTWVFNKWSDSISRRVSEDVQENVSFLQTVDSKLGSSLGTTHHKDVEEYYGALWRSYLRWADVTRAIYMGMALTVTYGLWGFAFHLAISGQFFPGGLLLRLTLAFASVLPAMIAGLALGVSFLVPATNWFRRRDAEYWIFFRLLWATVKLTNDDALTDRESSKELLAALRGGSRIAERFGGASSFQQP